MSIRALALDLYKAKQKMDSAQEEYDQAGPEEQIALGQELKLLQKDYQMIRRMLDGEKESGDFRKRFCGFGSTRT